MKKNFSPTFEPAILKQNAWRWYIEFYQKNPSSGALKRFRLTFNLNRKKYVSDHVLREQRARDLLAVVNASLPFGYPFACGLLAPGIVQAVQGRVVAKSKQKKSKDKKPGMTVDKALDFACRLKCQTDRDETIRTYQSITKLLKLFCKSKGWGGLPVKKFKGRHAVAYMDHCALDRGVGANTWNNNLRDCKVLFNVLLERGHVKANPFDKIKYKDKQEKERVNFSPEDARTVAAVIYEKNRLLFYALLTQYACFIRPAEMRRLRRSDFDLEKGIITLAAKQTKTGKRRTATIPDAFRVFFLEDEFLKIPGNFFVWGAGLAPHPRSQCGERSMYNHHSKILKALWETGKIERRKYTWYSWKDTGITDALQELRANSVREQAGHSDERITMLYYHAPKINKEMKGRKNTLMEV